MPRKFIGKTLLERQFDGLTKGGIQEIAIVTGYKRELLNIEGIKEFHNQNWATTNMVSSLACASKWLADKPCIVSYSDIFYEPHAVEQLMEDKSSLALTYDPNWLLLWSKRFENVLLDAETFRINSDGLLSAIGEKPRTVNEIQGQYMGLLRFTPDAWTEVLTLREYLKADIRRKIHMTGMLQEILNAGRIPIKAIPYNGIWGEIDLEKDLEVCNKLLNP